MNNTRKKGLKSMSQVTFGRAAPKPLNVYEQGDLGNIERLLETIANFRYKVVAGTIVPALFE
tara:strand:- start:40 stop:225 length:186 start_codon:yes stop_codon:yes gene_type:complete